MTQIDHQLTLSKQYIPQTGGSDSNSTPWMNEPGEIVHAFGEKTITLVEPQSLDSP